MSDTLRIIAGLFFVLCAFLLLAVCAFGWFPLLRNGMKKRREGKRGTWLIVAARVWLVLLGAGLIWLWVNLKEPELIVFFSFCLVLFTGWFPLLVSGNTKWGLALAVGFMAFLFMSLTGTGWPFGHQERINTANMTAIGARGKDIYFAIMSANTEREYLTPPLPSIWPRTQPVQQDDIVGDPDDIAYKAYTSSSEFFWDLYDGDNVGTDKWNPYVNGFDFSKLAGAGIKMLPADMPEAEKKAAFLTGDHNVWNIIANLPDDAPDNTPLMFTKNLDITIEDLIAIENPDAKDPKNRLKAKLGAAVKTPFGNKAIVVIRKDGRIFKCPGRYLDPPRNFIGDADFKAWSKLDPKPVILKASPEK